MWLKIFCAWREKSFFAGLAAEGIVFYRKGTNEMCKLRRDMFEWFTGRTYR